MTEIADFGQIVFVVAVGFSLALLGRAVTERFAVPAAALFLIAAAAASDLVPDLADELSFVTVERIGVVALIVILFDGGMDIGWRRFRASAAPILSLGVLGTFATAGLVASGAHYLLDLSWITSLLLGAAIAPTDPAVTFSVLGGREVRGRTGTILKGESGANDPVGIALMIGMIELATHDDEDFSIVISEFAVEMTLGLLVGLGGALALLPIMRHVRLTAPPLYPIRVLAGAGIIYGLAAVIGGSGFLAAFVAGVLLGDVAATRKGEIEGFLSSLSGLAEIAAFVALGLTVSLGDIESGETWLDGVVLALILAFVARPLAILPLLLPTRLTWGERVFIAWAGLKGAVPILLGALALLSGVEDAGRLYGIVFIVVLFSVVVQGASVPVVARRLRIPFRRIDHDLAEVLEFVVRDDAFASGRRIADLPLGERAWVGVFIRGGRPQPVTGSVLLQPGDRVHVYCQPEDAAALGRIFAGPAG